MAQIPGYLPTLQNPFGTGNSTGPQDLAQKTAQQHAQTLSNLNGGNWTCNTSGSLSPNNPGSESYSPSGELESECSSNPGMLGGLLDMVRGHATPEGSLDEIDNHGEGTGGQSLMTYSDPYHAHIVDSAPGTDPATVPVKATGNAD